MADLGVLPTMSSLVMTKQIVYAPRPLTMKRVKNAIVVRRAPTYADGPLYSDSLAVPPEATGVYTNVVTQNGVPLPDCKVLMFWRNNDRLVGAVRTDSDGRFTFTNLIPLAEGYYVIVFDRNSVGLQNALILDRVTPS